MLSHPLRCRPSEAFSHAPCAAVWYLFRELCSGLRQEKEGGACVNERVLSRSADCPNMIGLLLSKPDVKANVHSFMVVSNGLEEQAPRREESRPACESIVATLVEACSVSVWCGAAARDASRPKVYRTSSGTVDDGSDAYIKGTCMMAAVATRQDGEN